MRIVVDTNIIFSALLSQDGRIADLLLNSQNSFEFYTPSYTLGELKNHKSKLLKLSGLTDDELDFLQGMIFKNIGLVNIENIPKTTFLKAYELTKDIDENDTPFVALALELSSFLWTGDKKLLNGLKQKGLDWMLTTNNIGELRNKLNNDPFFRKDKNK